MRASEAEPSADDRCLETQLDFFHKLGYSTAQVEAVQQQLGSPSIDTDKVLGELVRVGHHHPVTTMSVLVARGDVKSVGPTAQLPVGLTAQLPVGLIAQPSAAGLLEESGDDEDALRPVVIDGSNVAMSHGNKEVFSCLGIQLTVNFFLDRGHTDVTVFVPSWRKEQPRPDVPITDQHILRDLEKKKILVFTPSRRVAGKRVVCNDDWFIVKLAYESDGVVVSNDMYRDLQGKEPEWKRFIEERLLMYSFVNNKFMPPDDPLGRHGPTLDNFLRRHPKTQKKQLCPYGKKCTFGNKCKFHHPERGKQSNHSLADELRENAAIQKLSPTRSSPVPGQSLLLVEDMAKKLTLGPDGGYGATKAKKDQKKDQVRPSQRSSKRTAHRPERGGRQSPDCRSASLPAESQEQLDSGLGSTDSWNDHQYGGSYGSLQHLHGLRSKFCPHPSSPAHHHQQGESDLSYGPPHFSTYVPYPVSRHAFSQPPDFQHSRHRHHHHHQQRNWSAPFETTPHPHPAPPHPPPPQRAQRSAPRGAQGTRPSRGGEREAVRKKLLAIFSAQLVETAMEMFPQEMDPQVLVAEIVSLQSLQGRPLR